MNHPLASIGDRFTAQFVDGLIALAIGALCYQMAKYLGWPLELMFGGWLVYLLVCDGLPNGQSIGKMLTRSSVVHVESGEPCKYWQSCVRNFSLIVFGLIDCVFLVGPARRRLGDYLGRTKVVRLG